MKVYHISRSSELKEGTVIKLYDNLEIGMDIDDKVLSKLLPNGIKEDGLSIDLIKELFPDGVSLHGINYLRDLYYPYGEDFMTDIKSSNQIISMAITEYSFELIRRLKYSHIPSRFETLFALENLDDIKKWPELITNNYKIFEIKVNNTQVFKLDASSLLSGVYLDQKICPQVEGFFAELNWRYSNKYWSSLDSKDMKKPELLIKLPVTIGKEIRL
jgi:hypothetical protein